MDGERGNPCPHIVCKSLACRDSTNALAGSSPPAGTRNLPCLQPWQMGESSILQRGPLSRKELSTGSAEGPGIPGDPAALCLRARQLPNQAQHRAPNVLFVSALQRISFILGETWEHLQMLNAPWIIIPFVEQSTVTPQLRSALLPLQT